MFSAREKCRVGGLRHITVGVTVFLLALAVKCVPSGRTNSPCCSLVSTLPIFRGANVSYGGFPRVFVSHLGSSQVE